MDSLSQPCARRRGGWRLIGLVLVGCALAGTGLLFAFRGVFQRVTVGRVWPPAERVSFDEIDHSPWSRLLEQYVDGEGDVDYTGWKASAADLQALDSYLDSLSRASPQQPSIRAARWHSGSTPTTP